MTYEDILDKILEDCEDQILNKDWSYLFDYIFSYKYIKKEAYPHDYPSIYVFCKLLSSILSSEDIMKLQNKLDFILYLYSSYLLGVKDVELTLSTLYFDHRYYIDYTELENIPTMLFNSIYINVDEGSRMLNDRIERCNVKTLVLDINEPRWAENSYSSFNADNLSVITRFSDSNYELFLPNGITTLEFATDVETLPYKLSPIAGVSINLSILILPEKDGLKIPRWIVTVGDNCKIYKNKGQKIEWYKNQTAWLKDHLISV